MKTRKVIFVCFLFLISFSTNIFATDLTPTACLRPATPEYIGNGFNVAFNIANQNILAANADRWSVFVQIKNASNQVIWTSTVLGVLINPYTSVQMQTSNTWIPTGAGTFSVVITVNHLDEINPANDVLTKFFTVFDKPNQVSNPIPQHGATNVSPTTPLDWTNPSDPFNQTVLHIWTSPTEVNWNTNAVITSTGYLNPYTPTSPFPGNTLIRWGVQQTNPAGTTNSDVFEFTTAWGPPDAISNCNPPNGAINIPIDQVLQWTNGIAPISQTTVHVWPNQSSVNWNSNVVVTNTSPNFSSYAPQTNWPYNSEVVWGVRQTNTNGSTNNGPFTFRTPSDPPGVITNISPQNNATNVPTNTILQWQNHLTIPVTQTDIFFVPSPSSVNFNSTPTVTNTQTITSWDPPGDLLPGTIYNWGVKQHNGGGSTNNGPFSFTTQNILAPSPITNISPQNNATNVPRNQPLSWNNGSNPFNQTVVHVWPNQSSVNWNTHGVVTASMPITSYTPTENWSPNSDIFWGVEQFNNTISTRNGPFTFHTQGVTDPNLNLLLAEVRDPNDVLIPPDGIIDINYPLGQNPFFINVLATNTSTNQNKVIVDNLLFPSTTESQTSPTFSSYFSFESLLNSDSQIPNSLNLKVYLSPSTITNTQSQPFPQTDLIADLNVDVGIFNRNAYNLTNEDPISILPVVRPGHTIGEVTQNKVYRSDIPNLDLDDSQHGDNATYAGDLNACVPTATANSIKWMESVYTDVSLPSSMTLRKTMEDLSSKMKRKKDEGTFPKEQVQGAVDFIEENALPIEVKFQSFYVTGNVGSTSGNSLARNLNTASKKPTWDFLKEQMKNGEDVVMNYHWKSGDKWYGHSVCLTGFEEFPSGVKKIKFKHDGTQGAAGGTKEDTYQITVDGDGWMRFGTNNRNFITVLVAKSPIIPLGRETAAWLNELFANPTQSNKIVGASTTAANPELVEILLSNVATDLNKYKVSLYDGTNGKVYNSFTLDLTSKTNNGNVTAYYMSFNNDELKPPPAGIAISYSGSPIPGQFWSYGGSFTAADGDAHGLTSTNMGNVIPGYGFALSGSGKDYQSFGWELTITSSPGLLNTNQSYSDQGPSKPTLLSPNDQSKNLNTTLTLSWNSSTNTQSYELQYSKDINFVTAVNNFLNISTTLKEISSLDYGELFYWRVRSKNSSGVSAFTDSRSFTTKLQSPSNLNALLDAQNKVNLSWIDNSTNESGFAIEKKPGQTQFAEITRVNPNILVYKDEDVQLNNTYSYRVRAYNTNAESDYSNTVSILVTGIDDENIPDEFQLYQNYPNPFNPTSVIKFDVPITSRIKIKLYNLLGRELATITDQEFSPGVYTIKIDLKGFASGVYYYTMESENFRDTKKLILLK